MSVAAVYPIQITARPRFTLRIDDTLASVVLLAARSHYDRACTSAAQEGGMLWPLVLWPEQRKRMDEGEDYPAVLTLSAHEIDLLAKICENRSALILDCAGLNVTGAQSLLSAFAHRHARARCGQPKRSRALR